MKNNKEILSRVKLLMNYEMGKTLEENMNSIEDDLIIEQVVPGLKGIFRIGGEELVAGLKNSMDDVVRFFREAGGVEIVSADGSITKAKNAGELIDALHSGRITAKTLGEVNSGLLRSTHTPQNVIDNILSQKGFETKFNQVYGGLKNQPDEIVKILKKKGFPDSTIEKMMEKMKLGDSSVKTATSQVGLSAQQIDDNISNVMNDSFKLNQQSVEDFLKDYSKRYGLKYNDAQLSQISKDFTTLIQREIEKQGVNATAQNVMKSLERMTDKEILALIDKVKMNVPPGFVQSSWTKLVDSVFTSSKKGGTSLAKSTWNGLVYLWKKGLGIAALVQIGELATNKMGYEPLQFGDTTTIGRGIWKTIAWPFYFWKYVDSEKPLTPGTSSSQSNSGALDAGGKINYNTTQPAQQTTTQPTQLFKRGEFDN